MNELLLLRELADETDIPDSAQLSAARDRLIRVIAHERASVNEVPRRNRRRFMPAGVTLATAGVTLATAVAAVVALTFVALIEHRRSQPAGLPALTAPQVLARAAFVALHKSSPIPSPNEFIYTKTKVSDGSTIQSWLSVDGRRTSLLHSHRVPGCVDGRMDLGPIGSRSCTPVRAYFPEMPTRATDMLSYLERAQGISPRDINDLAKTVGELLGTDYLLPAQQAALYEFLAKTPGITTFTGVTDAAGRSGVGVGWRADRGAAVLIFDRATSAYLGMTTRGVAGQIGGEALLETAIVSRLGELPRSGETTAGPDNA